MSIVIRKGIRVPLAGAPAQEIAATGTVTDVALLGADHPRLRPEFLVKENQAVARGTPLYRDRNRPGIVFVSPVCGRVGKISLGAKRRLATLTIRAEGQTALRFDPSCALAREPLTRLLLESGCWPALRMRPFGGTPDPGSLPDAIFITAVDTEPHAPDPAVALSGLEAEFRRGVRALSRLTDGPVFVCQAPGAPLADEVADEWDQVRCVAVSGPHPAGLAGTHIARLRPVAAQRRVWQIGYQDTAAIGYLLTHGEILGERVVSLAGPGLRNPRLARVPLGADLHQLVRGSLTGGQKLVLSGSALSGRESRYLGRYHSQATVLNRPAERRRNWLIAALRRAARPAPFIPTQALEQAFGPNVAAVPLLRALAVGDAETAARLGALSLLEEDVALATYVTGGHTDFAAKLRVVLDALEEAA